MSTQFKYYAKELLKIALPIIMGNLGFILIGAGDVLVAGHHSTDTLAAISIATAITNCIQTFGIGLIASVSPLLSNYRGEKKSAKKYFFPTIRFSMVLGVIVMFAVLASIPLIDYLHFEAKLVPMIKEYMFVTAFATFGGYLHAALKEFLQAFEIVLFPNLVTVFSVFLNIALNVTLVFGLGPFPSLGVLGLAVASFIVRYFMGFALLIYCFRVMNFNDYKDFEYYKSLIKIGIPISCAIMVEFIAFNSIAIIMGRVSGVYAAAQNLICTLTTVSFMVPLAISNAIAVKVGFANGSKNINDLKRYSFVGIVMSVGFMMLSALIFSSFPNFLVGLFTQDSNLVKISVPVLYILSVFQIFDGLQIALAGIFKGMKRTGIVLISNFIAYWLLSIPLGYTLAFRFNLNLRGFWYGLAAAAVLLCVMMVIMLLKSIKKLESIN
ncbi:putative multidrug resistance protein NorM (Na(+)/drug antiporter) [Fusobacterium sp. CAG:439]|nr:putative multidrug resistance protein NorM (Na(+)/drug antiporter) [Fusobacterium sp. CAG:439]